MQRWGGAGWMRQRIQPHLAADAGPQPGFASRGTKERQNVGTPAWVPVGKMCCSVKGDWFVQSLNVVLISEGCFPGSSGKPGKISSKLGHLMSGRQTAEK